jgi:hypothetical protein
MNTLGKIFATIIVFLGAFLVSLLQTEIIISLSKLYGLSFIYQFSFTQIYGTLLVVGIAKYKLDNSKSEEKQYSERIKEGFVGLITSAILLLFIWFVSYLFYFMMP